MRHVDHQIGTDGIGDGPEARPIDKPRVGREAGDDHLGAMIKGQTLDLGVVDLAGLGIQAVLDRVVDLAREVRLGTVREVTAVRQAHAEHGVAGLAQGHEDRGVGLGAGMRLDVGVVGAEQLLGAIDGEALGHVHVLAAAVVAFARIPFGIFVGQDTALSRQDTRARVVLGGDELDVLLLATLLVLDCTPELRIVVADLHAFLEHRSFPRRRKAAQCIDFPVPRRYLGRAVPKR